MLDKHTEFLGSGGAGKTTAQRHLVSPLRLHPKFRVPESLAVLSGTWNAADSIGSGASTLYSYFKLGQFFDKPVSYYVTLAEKDPGLKQRILGLKRMFLTEGGLVTPAHINKLSELLKQIRMCDQDPLQVIRANREVMQPDDDPPQR